MARPKASPEGLTGSVQKFNRISYLSAFLGALRGHSRQTESVDLIIACLYKPANSGGRNPAATVL